MSLEKYKLRDKRAFTLVELIVTIVILAILASIAFLSFSTQSASARDSKRKTDVKQIGSKINTMLAASSNIMSLITKNENQMMTGSTGLAGTGFLTASGGNYIAGVPNFAMIGANPADFTDPTDKGGLSTRWPGRITTEVSTRSLPSLRMTITEM